MDDLSLEQQNIISLIDSYKTENIKLAFILAKSIWFDLESYIM